MCEHATIGMSDTLDYLKAEQRPGKTGQRAERRSLLFEEYNGVLIKPFSKAALQMA